MKDFKNDIKLARKGDTDAFARLYTIVYKQMYHTALYNLRNEHDACDAVSEAVIDAFASIKNLKNEDAFKSWIMKILFTKIKRRQKEYINSSGELSEETKTEEFEFQNAELKQALEMLDNDSRAILSLSVLGGYNSEEISKIFGMKASSVRSRLARIKEQLRINLTV
ncbi:MAG: RNA polymerase sigma factor [Ruminococcus sp.]|nr:RNA polymerase sigma factor [Ruminococcus sp.]